MGTIAVGGGTLNDVNYTLVLLCMGDGSVPVTGVVSCEVLSGVVVTGTANFYGMVMSHNDETESWVSYSVGSRGMFRNLSKFHPGYMSGVLGATESTAMAYGPVEGSAPGAKGHVERGAFHLSNTSVEYCMIWMDVVSKMVLGPGGRNVVVAPWCGMGWNVHGMDEMGSMDENVVVE